MTGALTYTLEPFPGLRPFEPEHSALFFGREEQTDELLRRLERTRFLAVVGDSGSGKSSLVRAGLIPALQRGYMAEAGSRWQIALFRPGDDPVGNLARALHRSGKSGDGTPDAAQLQGILERNSMGLVQAAAATLPPKTNLLVVVDQFEEIFRYKRETQKRDGGDSAAAFVKLLLNASQEETSVVNVVLTMRSDFLGECSQFRGLPEALNGGQYLVPRLTREQMKEAIEGPALVAGSEFAPMLVQRLLNDVGDSPDQLPVLQHALMRTWDEAAASRESGEPISLSHYEAIGGITQALNRHVQSAYQELSPGDQQIAKKIFQRLTERAKGGRDIRRPTKVSELAAVAGEPEERVIAVINKFREAGRTFLTSPDSATLNSGSIIDVTHESLIRLWDTLHEWVAEEADSAHLYRRLAESAVEGRAAYHDQDLKQALAWQAATRPNEAWAGRYHPAFRRSMEFLDWSWKRDLARHRRKVAAVTGLCILTVVAAGFALKTFFQDRELGARELLADAERYQALAGAAIETSSLLAIESLNLHRVVDSESVLRENIALLPQPIATLAEDGSVQAISFSPDGSMLATGSDDGLVRVFAIARGKELFHLNAETPVLSVMFSPDGRTLAAGSFKGAALVEATTGKRIAALNSDTAVYSIAFSPDSSRVVTGDGNGAARVFDAATGKELWVANHGGIVNAVAFSPSGQIVATGSGDGTARILAAGSGKQLFSLQLTGEVRDLAFSPDGQFLATGGAATRDVNGAGTAHVFEVKTGKEITHVMHHGMVNAVAFSPDGARVVSGSQDGVARVFSVRDGSDFSHYDHDGAVVDVAFSADGRWVATASWDHTGRLFEAGSGKEIARLIHADKVRAVAFSPDGRMVATGSSDHTARVFAARNGNATARVPHNSPVFRAAFSPNGELVATVSKRNNMRVLQPDSGAEIKMRLSQAKINTLAFSEDGKLLAVGSDDGRTLVYEAATGHETGRAEDLFPVVATVFSPDGRNVACGHSDGLVQVFEARGGNEIFRVTLGSRTLLPPDAVRVIQFSPDGSRIMTGNDNMSQIFEVATGREIARYQHQGTVQAIAFGPQGNIALSGSDDGTVALLEMSSVGRADTIKKPGRVTAVAFSHDESLFATGGSIPKSDGSAGGTAQVFDTVSRKELVSLVLDRPVRSVIFSPDDRWVAAVSEDDVIQIFKAINGDKVALIHSDEIKDVRFTQDGATLQVLSSEAVGPGEPSALSIENHLLRTQDLIHEGCSRLTRNLTEEEWKSFFNNQPYRKTCPM